MGGNRKIADAAPAGAGRFSFLLAPTAGAMGYRMTSRSKMRETYLTHPVPIATCDGHSGHACSGGLRPPFGVSTFTTAGRGCDARAHNHPDASGATPPESAERVPHLLLDTGILTRLAPNGAPKGRNNEAQANGLGPRTPSRQPTSPERAKYRSEPRRAVVKLETAALITPFQGFRIGDRRTRGPRPLAWASLFRPFGAESTHTPVSSRRYG